jgi:hypothetical protein
MSNDVASQFSRELTAIDIAIRLDLTMRQRGDHIVAAETGVCLERLLKMISLEKAFSRPVLRYLRIRKIYVEWDAERSAP